MTNRKCTPIAGEPSFTLLARDKAAPITILHWICQRGSQGYDDPEDLERVGQADQIADEMVAWREANKGDDDTLATWRRGSLFAEPEPDRFTSESPLRAFTTWQESDLYAIGKGFRPSASHLATYLTEIERQEGFRLEQILYAGEPERLTVVFRRDQKPIDVPAVGAPTGTQTEDDPVNPSHYAGRACADLGEHMSANGYQVFKYLWRAGKKGPADVDLRKALWYLESEIALLAAAGNNTRFNRKHGLSTLLVLSRLSGQSEFVNAVAHTLLYSYDRKDLEGIRGIIQKQLDGDAA